jgi:hypothetical protein
MVWADTEICPYFGLGRYGVLPLLWVGRARLDTLAGHRECCAKVCPYELTKISLNCEIVMLTQISIIK